MASPTPPRASPDALLALAEREGRGKLRVFLGAAPGVGKTFAMLQAARAATEGGEEVVVGIVETHGRRETEALVRRLEVLPRAQIPYRGRLVPEFDVDAALARRPRLLLVDEYAHSNVPSSRHPKRWQDVRELLDAGIDVWTTLNVQHLESLNDVVQKISGVRVRETVPDSALEEADDIVLVDLPPDELLKRLADGKIYVEDTAARAVQNFFKPSNLTALRELALRRVAARVDSDLVERMQGGAIEGPWAAGERILVCVGADAAAARLVRHAKRLADLMDASWFAVAVERPGSDLDPAARARRDAALRLAESLGAETRALVATDRVGEILRVARFENVTQIVVGRARPKLFARLFRPSLPEELVRSADGIAVHVVTSERGEDARRGWRDRLPDPGPLRGYLEATVGVALAVGVGHGLTQVVALPNISMLFLTAVLVPAVRSGVWPAIYASALSFLTYNFFFIDPLYTFTIARPHELLALAIFLLIAVVTSAVAGRAREQARAAIKRVRATRRLYEFTRKLSSLPAADAVAEAAAAEIQAIVGRSAVLLREQAGELGVAAAWPPEDRLDTASMMAARWAFEHKEAAGADTGTLPNVPWLFLPLVAGRGPIGVVGIEDAPDGVHLDAERRSLLDSLVEQTAVALDRATLAGEIEATRMAAETERIRNILLASISHDFRTPLASVLGAATSLTELGDRLAPAERADLLVSIREEAEHLDGMVRNLLAMTRLEAGALEIRMDWTDLGEILERVAAAARRRGATQAITVTTTPDLPLAFADPILLDQALGNIVGNAVRYAGPSARIALSASADDRNLSLAVDDDGPGIDPALLPHVFEKFIRASAERGDGGEGSGLGLAIAKGIAEAHGGSVHVESPVTNGRGTRFTLVLPRRRIAP
ncbi:sensor histidine kinase [Chthonobacter albigriseus]|uniref:sensor histidine kinase n=1 Tax=Chthonobacter albigriseus TaxID=1683161 RepID=UPI0015EFC472|nr:sensor histidine kinase KdpD [Chthonobacter albigriseus]